MDVLVVSVSCLPASLSAEIAAYINADFLAITLSLTHEPHHFLSIYQTLLFALLAQMDSCSVACGPLVSQQTSVLPSAAAPPSREVQLSGYLSEIPGDFPGQLTHNVNYLPNSSSQAGQSCGLGSVSAPVSVSGPSICTNQARGSSVGKSLGPVIQRDNANICAVIVSDTAQNFGSGWPQTNAAQASPTHKHEDSSGYSWDYKSSMDDKVENASQRRELPPTHAVISPDKHHFPALDCCPASPGSDNGQQPHSSERTESVHSTLGSDIGEPMSEAAVVVSDGHPSINQRMNLGGSGHVYDSIKPLSADQDWWTAQQGYCLSSQHINRDERRRERRTTLKAKGGLVTTGHQISSAPIFLQVFR